MGERAQVIRLVQQGMLAQHVAAEQADIPPSVPQGAGDFRLTHGIRDSADL
jgi:hypothetical protein